MQLSKKQILQNRKDYFNKAIECDIRLIIIGQDVYPNNQNGIPFCKEDFELLEKTCFNAVLNSFCLNIDYALNKFDSPKELMFYFLENGVLFLNLSYSLLRDSKNKSNELKKALMINKRLLSNLKPGDKYFIKLGKAHPYYFNCLVQQFGENLSERIIHPSARNKNNPKTKAEWMLYWGVPGYLKAVLYSLKGVYLKF